MDIVCDLSGIPNDPASEINPNFTWKINYYGRIKFAKLAKLAGVSRFIFNSTCSIYGYNKNKVFEFSKKIQLARMRRQIIKLKNLFIKCVQKILKLMY